MIQKNCIGRLKNSIQINNIHIQNQNLDQNIDQEEDLKLINEEIKNMLDEVVSYKTNAYNKLKANKIEEAKPIEQM